jgi:hypothetical protein
MGDLSIAFPGFHWVFFKSGEEIIISGKLEEADLAPSHGKSQRPV